MLSDWWKGFLKEGGNGKANEEVVREFFWWQ